MTWKPSDDVDQNIRTAATRVEGAPVEITATGIATLITKRTFRGRLKPGTPLARLQMSEALEGEKVTVKAKP